jgi:hypothetical protein
MKILVNIEYGHKHVFTRHASKSFAHLQRVSGISWCEHCGAESVMFIGPLNDDCYRRTELTGCWDGEDDVCCSKSQIDRAVDKVKRHMLKVLREIKKNKMDWPEFNQFQGINQYSSRAYRELIDSGKIKEVGIRIELI